MTKLRIERQKEREGNGCRDYLQVFFLERCSKLYSFVCRGVPPAGASFPLPGAQSVGIGPEWSIGPIRLRHLQQSLRNNTGASAGVLPLYSPHYQLCLFQISRFDISASGIGMT